MENAREFMKKLEEDEALKERLTGKEAIHTDTTILNVLTAIG